MKVVVAFLVAFASVQMGYSQTIARPANNGSSSSVRICALSGSPVFTITSSFTGAFSGSNTFSLLLSDEDGFFDENNPNVIGESPTNLITNNIEFSVDISEFIEPFKGSDNYEMRIVASQGDIPSPDKDFAIYYRDNTTLVAEPRCLFGGGTFTATPSDLDSYIWFKDGVLIPGETSNSLVVNQVGEYRFSVDYGDCQATYGNTALSNIAYVRADAGTEINITGPTSYSRCSDEGDKVTLNSSITNSSFVYEWYKDGVKLTDITSETLTVTGSNTPTFTVWGIDMEGDYRVLFKESIGSDECGNQSAEVSIELLNPKISITSPTTVLLLPPGEPKTLTAQVIRGTNPVIAWFRNGTLIENSNSENLEVTEAGVYTVRLTADPDSPCPEDNIVFAKEEVNVGSAENLAITIDYRDPANYDNCELSEVILDVTQVVATINGNTETLDESQLGSLQVDWHRDGVTTGESAENILINSASGNGDYTAQIDLDGDENTTDDIVVSNELPVILALDSFVISKSNDILPLDGEIFLSLGLDSDATGYTFQWFKNNTEEIPDSNSQEITINEPGLYSVDVFFSICGSETVGPITVTTGSPVIPNVITPNGDSINDDWILTGDLTLKEDVEINIYASNGELDYSATNYDGEWPTESKSKAVGTIYYYVISKDNTPIEQGSITIIR